MLIHRIPGVFNYCDSWCDRCRLQRSCEVYYELRIMEGGGTVERELPERDWHDALDIPPMTEEEIAEYAADQRRRDALTARHPIARNASIYSRQVRDWRLLQPPSRPAADPVLNLAWDSIHTLSLTVSVKAHRAVHALIDRDNDAEWIDRTLDPRGVQSDGNGTAKLLRLILRELLEAWRVVAADPDERGVNPAAMIVLLQRIDTDLTVAFPYAMEFVRPGFDE